MKKNIITTKHCYDLPILSFPNIPNSQDKEYNKYYQFQVFDPVVISNEYNTEGCGFYATKKHLNYVDFQRGSTISLPFKVLNNGFLSPNGKMHSFWLESFMPTSFNIPSRIYHLAAVIKNEHPLIDWDFENQLHSFENKMRQNFTSLIAEEIVKIRNEKRLIKESDLILSEFEYQKYIQTNPGDDALKTHVLEQMAYWEQDLNLEHKNHQIKLVKP